MVKELKIDTAALFTCQEMH